MVPAGDEPPEFTVVGDEALNKKASTFLRECLRQDETLIAVSGFDFEDKLLAITDHRIVVTGEENGVGVLVLSVNHDDLSLITRDGRTLVLETSNAEEYRYRFGKDQTAEELVGIAIRQQIDATGFESEKKLSIAERVRFWEEQDKINQELIPRFIRQNELLTKHIGEHDSLPDVAGRAISEALARAREEQHHQYEADLDAAKRELSGQAQASVEQALATLRQESQKTRRLLVGITFAAVAIGVAALIVGLLA